MALHVGLHAIKNPGADALFWNTSVSEGYFGSIWNSDCFFHPTISGFMKRQRRIIACALALLAFGIGTAGCQPPASEPLAAERARADTIEGERVASNASDVVFPALETYADTLAMRVYEASGGPAAWQALRYLRFNYAILRERQADHIVHHFWDRGAGDYRLEFPGPGGFPYVVLFNVNTRAGHAYWQGVELDPTETARQLEAAYRRYTNDTFWLLAPFKLFDPGVQRGYLPDSSTATYDVVHLRLPDADLLPSDEYWLYIDKASGRLATWSYVAEGDAPDAPARTFVWDNYVEQVTPGGSLFLATRKRGVWSPFAVLTSGIETPTLVPDDLFTAGEPRLMPAASE